MNDVTAATEAVNNVFGTTISPDIFMTKTDSLFDGLTEDDLSLPEKLVFLKGENVQATVINIDENTKYGMIKLEVKILTGDHQGKLTDFAWFKPKVVDGKMSATSKKKWVNLLLCFWDKQSVLSGNIDMTKPIGQTVQFTAGEAKDWNGKLQQDIFNLKVVE